MPLNVSLALVFVALFSSATVLPGIALRFRGLRARTASAVLRTLPHGTFARRVGQFGPLYARCRRFCVRPLASCYGVFVFSVFKIKGHRAVSIISCMLYDCHLFPWMCIF